MRFLNPVRRWARLRHSADLLFVFVMVRPRFVEPKTRRRGRGYTDRGVLSWYVIDDRKIT